MREFEAFEQQDASAVFLVDAGLNLNKKAFNNLRQAETETGYLKRSGGLWRPCCLWPEIARYLSVDSGGHGWSFPAE